MAKKKSKKKSKSSSFPLVISFLFFVLSCLLLYFIISLKILPDKYLLTLIGVLIAVNLVFFLLIKFTKSTIIKFLSVLLCAGLFYGVCSVSSTSSLLTDMSIDYKTHNYVVLVNSNSSYRKIEDLKNKNIGYLVDDKEILSKLTIQYKEKEYKDINLIATALLDNDIDGIILEQSYIDMLSETDSPIPEFKDNIRVIYDFKINTKVVDISKDVNTTNDVFCIYISGVDTYGAISSVSRTDANILVFVNPNTKQVLMLSIPRDYYINLAGKSGKDKLTHSGIYGIDTTVKSIEALLNIDINYYYKINFTSLINIVDSLGGVDVYSEYSFTSRDGYNYTKGYNHVNGKEALSFVRERKAFNAGDRVRNINQQALVEALFRKCTSSSIIARYNNLLSGLKNSFVTNMNYDRLTALIKMQLEDNSKWNITSYSLDGTNSSEYTYSYKSNKLYVMLPDNETISTAKKMINDVYNGKTLSSSYSSNIGKINSVSQNKITSKKSNYNSNIVSNSNSNHNSNTIVEENNSKFYKITYKIDNEEQIVEVEEGSILIPVEIPEKAGYNSLGWYLDDSIYDFSIPITRDLILTAKYEEVIIQEGTIEEQIQEELIEEKEDITEQE